MDISKWGITPHVIMIGDPGKDLDDEFSFVLAAALHKLGIIKLLGVVANLYPAAERAKLTRGTFNCLGMSDLPVGLGTEVTAPEHHAKYKYETEVPYLEPHGIVDGFSLLVRLMTCSAPQSLTLVLNSGMTDAWRMYEHDPALFCEKVRHVVIMGGVELDSDGELLHNPDGSITPNNANNNTFDFDSARALYAALQQDNVPLTITMRDAAYASQIPFSVYDDLLKTNNPIGACLKNRQQPSLQKLWEAACSEPGSDIRGTLPDDRNRAWFCKVFCHGNDPGIEDGADIWPHIGDFNLYDPINLLAAIPSIRERFFTPTTFMVDETEHRVLGISTENTGVKDSREIRQFLIEILTYALTSEGAVLWRSLPDYGDHMPLSEWLGSVECGGFIDYDGSGELATETHCSNVRISPSQVDLFTFPKWATHIVWYNR